MKIQTTAAQAAQLIRKDLKIKFPKIKFSVRSQNYSMGDNVNVEYQDGAPQSEIEKVLNKYQKGDVDVRTDTYEYNNDIDGLPQTKYLFVNREISPEIKERVKKEIASEYGIDNLDDEKQWFAKCGRWSDQVLWKRLQEQTF